MKRWNAFWFAPGSATTLGVCRALFFGGVFLWQLPRDFSPWGAYSSVFWMPIPLFSSLGIPQFSAHTIGWMEAVWKGSLLLAAIGLFTRPAMAVAFLFGTYLMGLPHNFGQTQHFDTLVVFASGVLLLSRAADACSLDALIAAAVRRDAAPPPDSPEYTWPIRFVWLAMSLIFCAAGISKLRHSGLEWVFSDNLAWLLLRQQYHLSDGEPLTTWGIWVANHSWAARTMAAAAVSVETLFPLVLFSRRARWVLVPAGLSFLVGIRMLMGPTFEQFMVCYVFWVPWSRVADFVRGRLPSGAARTVLFDTDCGLCTRTSVVLSRLDVFRRLRHADLNADTDALATYPSLDLDACRTTMHVIVRRRGDRRVSVLSGFDAYRSIAWALPAAWPLLPLLYVPGVPAIGRLVYRFVASHRATTCRVHESKPAA